MSDLRRPPLTLLPGVAKGQCRMCGQLVRDKAGNLQLRKTWHFECAEEWVIANQPAAAKRAVLYRDEGCCAGCGLVCEVSHIARNGRKVFSTIHPWDADHIVPLAIAPADMYYWGLGNLQTLCLECHREKTRSDMVLIRGSRGIRERKRTHAVEGVTQ